MGGVGKKMSTEKNRSSVLGSQKMAPTENETDKFLYTIHIYTHP